MSGVPPAFLTVCCSSSQDNNIIMKYADDISILGLIRGGDKSSYWDQVHNITIYGEDKT